MPTRDLEDLFTWYLESYVYPPGQNGNPVEPIIDSPKPDLNIESIVAALKSHKNNGLTDADANDPEREKEYGLNSSTSRKISFTGLQGMGMSGLSFKLVLLCGVTTLLLSCFFESTYNYLWLDGATITSLLISIYVFSSVRAYIGKRKLDELD